MTQTHRSFAFAERGRGLVHAAQWGGQNQQTSSNSAPSPVIQPALQDVLARLQSYYGANPTAPAYYPGGTVAPQSAQTQAAIDALFNRGASGSSLGSAANRYAVDTLGGKYLDLNVNPYFQGALAASLAPVTRNFVDNVLPSVASQFEGAGRYGSGADRAATQAALTSFNTANANAATTAANTAYNQGVQNQLVAAGLFPAFQAADYQNIGAMGQAGSAIDQYRQANTNADVARYNYDSTAQPNYLAQQAQQYLAAYPGGQTTSNSSGGYYGNSTPASNSNAFANILGSLFSDARLKDDITPVGRLNDGQTVYAYRLKGSPRTELGLLAQEVERRHPEAVATDRSGFKRVHYGRATAEARAPRGGLL